MTTIIGMSGSLRRGSFNTMLLKAAAELVPDRAQVEIASYRDFPLYDADIETEQGIPPMVSALKDRIANADGLLLVTPEYNNSMPGVLKNAIDWLTRPGKDIPRVFGGRPVAVMGATPGRGGTILAQAAWLPVFRTLRTKPWFGPPLRLSEAAKVFDETGTLTDEKLREQVQAFMAGFVAFIRASQ